MAFDEGFCQVPPSASAFGDDDKPPPPNAGSKVGAVEMLAPKYTKREVSVGEDELTVYVDIKAVGSAAMSREGVDLVAVVDVSGSMKGHKIESAKAALQFVILKLTPQDRLSVVTFNSSAKRVSRLMCMTEAGKKELKGIVGSLTANGGTDINSGLVKGLEVLAGRVHTESRTGNIFLMSDGKNDGTSSGDATKVDPGDVVVYTFGFGAGTDHKLLGKLATNSTSGTYSSVPDEASLSISFGLMLAGVVTVVAQDVKVTLKPYTIKGKAQDVEKMTVADGSDYKQTTDARTGLITISFGSLFSGEVRTVAVHFKLKNTGTARSVTLAFADYSYAGQQSRRAATNLRVKRTGDPTPPDSASLEWRSTEAERIRREHAKNIKDSCELARAKRLQEARDKVNEGLNNIVDIWLDDGDKMLNGLRAELKQLLDYMATQKLFDDLGDSFGLAAIISHARQRAAGRGLHVLIVNIFLTPRMPDYVHQAKRFEENPTEPPPSAADDAKDEILCNPLAAVSAPIAFNLHQAIRALQAIQKMLDDANQRHTFC